MRRRHAAYACLAVLASMGTAACAPRQARIETDPVGGEEVRRRLESAARSDLATIQRAQADRLAEAAAYTYDLAVLGFDASPGVTVSILEASSTGYAAVAQAGSAECAVFVGSADPPRAYARTAGVVACRS